MNSLRPLTLGPVEIVVVSLDGDTEAKGVRAALLEQVQHGTIRLLDIAVLIRDADGDVEWSEVDADELCLTGLEPLTPGLSGIDDFRRLAQHVRIGARALVILIELTSARRLSEQIASSGGEVVVSAFIPAPVANVVLELALDEQ